MEQFFASDHHLDHENIIKFCNRPFSNTKEMNEALLTYHNQTVKPSDHVNFLGDVTLRRGGRQDREWLIKEIKKYNGHKRLYLGNHDHFPIQVYIEAGFEKIYATWRNEQGLLFSHFPIHPRSLGSAKANIHGHIHNNQGGKFEPVIKIDKNQRVITIPYINISLEVINYTPVSLDTLLTMVSKETGEFDGVKV